MQRTDYKKSMKIIYSIANRRTKNPNIRDELVSIGNEAFIDHKKSYKRGKRSKFSSYIWMKITYDIGNALTRIERESKNLVFISDLKSFDGMISHSIRKKEGKWIINNINFNHKITDFDDILLSLSLKELSNDAKKVLKIILKTDSNLNKRELRKHIHSNLNLKYKIIDSLFKEIKEKISLC